MMAVFGVSDSIDLVLVLNMPITQLSWDLCPHMKSSAICNNLLLLLLPVPDLLVWGKFSLWQELCLESEYHHHHHVRITPLIQMLQRCWKGGPGCLSHCGGWGQCLTQWGHQTVVQYYSKSSFLLKEALKLLIPRFCSICHQNIHPNPGFMVRSSHCWTIYILSSVELTVNSEQLGLEGSSSVEDFCCAQMHRGILYI